MRDWQRLFVSLRIIFIFIIIIIIGSTALGVPCLPQSENSSQITF